MLLSGAQTGRRDVAGGNKLSSADFLIGPPAQDAAREDAPSQDDRWERGQATKQRRKFVSPSHWMRKSQQEQMRNERRNAIDSPSARIALASLKTENKVKVLRELHSRIIESEHLPKQATAPTALPEGQHAQQPAAQRQDQQGCSVPKNSLASPGGRGRTRAPLLPASPQHLQDAASLSGRHAINPDSSPFPLPSSPSETPAVASSSPFAPSPPPQSFFASGLITSFGARVPVTPISHVAFSPAALAWSGHRAGPASPTPSTPPSASSPQPQTDHVERSLLFSSPLLSFPTLKASSKEEQQATHGSPTPPPGGARASESPGGARILLPAPGKEHSGGYASGGACGVPEGPLQGEASGGQAETLLEQWGGMLKRALLSPLGGNSAKGGRDVGEGRRDEGMPHPLPPHAGGGTPPYAKGTPLGGGDATSPANVEDLMWRAFMETRSARMVCEVRRNARSKLEEISASLQDAASALDRLPLAEAQSRPQKALEGDKGAVWEAHGGRVATPRMVLVMAGDTDAYDALNDMSRWC